MKYKLEINILSKINVFDLPENIYGHNPKKLIEELSCILNSIQNEDEISKETLERIIQIHEIADELSENNDYKLRVDLEKFYSVTVSVLRSEILHSSKEIEEIIELLKQSIIEEKALIRIVESHKLEIRGNADGLRQMALQLLNASIGKLSYLNEDDREGRTFEHGTKIRLNYYENVKEDQEYKKSYKDKVLEIGCILAFIAIIFLIVIGLIQTIKWVL